MCGQKLCAFAVKAYVLVVADVNLREVVLVEVAALQHVAFRQNLLFLQFVLGAEHEPGAVQFLVLLLHLLRLLLVLLSERGYIVVQSCNGIALNLYESVLLGKACLQFLNACGLCLHLRLQVLYRLLQLGGTHAAAVELLLQLCYHLAVLLHGLLYELHVLAYDFLAACALRTGFGNGHTAFRLVDATDALLHFVESAQDVVQLNVLLVDDALQ